MPLFNGPDMRDFLRLERHLENIEGQLNVLVEKQHDHENEPNGHPAKVVWHGMTWPQLMGIGMLILLLVLVSALVGVNFFAELPAIREAADALTQTSPSGG